MSQYGDSREIEGVTLVPVLATSQWMPAELASPIEGFVCTNREQGLGQAHSLRVTAEVRDRFIGRPYSDWLALPLSVHSLAVALAGYRLFELVDGPLAGDRLLPVQTAKIVLEFPTGPAAHYELRGDCRFHYVPRPDRREHFSGQHQVMWRDPFA